LEHIKRHIFSYSYKTQQIWKKIRGIDIEEEVDKSLKYIPLLKLTFNTPKSPTKLIIRNFDSFDPKGNF
jgi:hypothetical protein